jgi:hypothetical protein
MAFQGRYCLFLMGLFAIYCGSIYNDCMSTPLAIYKTAYPTYYEPNNSTRVVCHISIYRSLYFF